MIIRMAVKLKPEIARRLLGSKRFLHWHPGARINVGLGLPFKDLSAAFVYVGQSYQNNTSPKPDIKRSIEKHYSPAEVAEMWGVSTETIRSIFRDEPGVLKVGKPGTRSKRGYFTLRIPMDVVERVHTRLSA